MCRNERTSCGTRPGSTCHQNTSCTPYMYLESCFREHASRVELLDSLNTQKHHASCFMVSMAIQADGQQRGPLTCPVTIRADVSSGALHLGDSTTIPLPISGSGVFDVVYCDQDLRIFTSAGSYSIQVRNTTDAASPLTTSGAADTAVVHVAQILYWCMSWNMRVITGT